MQTHFGTPALASREIRRSDGSGVQLRNALDRYLEDTARAPRLSAAAELSAALELRRLKRQLWFTLLSEPRLRVWLLPLVAKHLEADRVPPQLRAPRLWARLDPATLASALVLADRDGHAARAVQRALMEAEMEAEVDPGFARACEEAGAAVATARDTFVNANLGLVIMVARRYERGHLSLADLIQEGNTGLVKAVDRFDPERGFRFSTYAVWWIRHAIGRSLSDKSREIRVPVHVAERQQTLRRARAEFELRHGRDPSVEELAGVTGWPASKVEDLLRVDYGRALAKDPETGRMMAMSPDALAADADEPDLDAQILGRHLSEALQSLPGMQQDILRRRFGLDGEPPMTLREVGEIHNLSRERIRQLQDRALNDLRRQFAAHRLLD